MRVPKGYWHTPKGESELQEVADRSIVAKDLADRHRISVFAVYKALHYRRTRLLNHSNGDGQASKDTADILAKTMAFAESIVGPFLKIEMDKLRSQVAVLKAERDEATRRADLAEARNKEQDREIAGFRSRLNRRAMETAGIQSGD